MVSRIPGARKSENEARTRARILRGTAHGKIPVLRQTTRCQGRARDAAAPPRPASPRFPETPRPGFLGLPPGSGRARRSGPERAGAGRSARAAWEAASAAGAERRGGPRGKRFVPGLVPRAPAAPRRRRALRGPSARGRVCAGRAAEQRARELVRPAEADAALRSRRRSRTPRHKGWSDVGATEESAKGKRKPRAGPVTG